MPPYKFLGHFQHTIDSKNRVAIPAKFRQQIDGGKLMVMESFDGCLQVLPETEWNKLAEKRLADMDYIGNPRDREIQRMFFGSMAECEMDRQGRIGLTQNQIDVAGIGKEVVFKGVWNRFEIWDRKRWEAHRADYQKREEAGLL